MNRVLGYAVVDYPQTIAAVYKERGTADKLRVRLLTTHEWMNEHIKVVEIRESMLDGESGVNKNAAWMMRNGHWGIQPSYQGCSS